MHTPVGITVAVLLAAPVGLLYAADPAPKSERVLMGERLVIGTVRDVKADQIELDIGEVEPRYIPLKQAQEKGFPDIKKGDKIKLTVNDQNLIVDYHPLAGTRGPHQVIRGQVATPLVVGHDRAVIRTREGDEHGFPIRSQARSKVASLPVGVDAVFLIDETNHIVDVTYGSQEAVERAAEEWKQKSPLKGSDRRVEGTISAPLRKNSIMIRTSDGKEESYEIRPLIEDQIAKLANGERVILLIDNEDKVADVAIP